MSVPTSTSLQPDLGRPGEQCLHCGAELAPDQRYCLNCGLRRTGPRVEYRELLFGEEDGPAGATAAPPAEAAAPPAAAPPAEQSRAISPLGAALAIGLLLLATLLGAVIGRGSGSDAQQPVVVGGAPAAATAAAVTGDWKAGDAWTVQLQAFPKDGTTPQQIQQAESAAQAKGAQDVGVLVTDEYPSLTAGQYVIYSGDFASRAEAAKALAGLKTSFPDAIVIQVSKTPAAAEAGAAAGAAKAKGSSGDSSAGGSSSPPADLQGLEQSTSTKDYVNKSKKLPDKVGTGGSAPPTDNKAPGGDSGGGQTIG